jgi:D-sedoheptulose 7-phosphate isomerase
MTDEASALSDRIAERLRARNAVSRRFFPREAPRLAAACREMSERFLEGGRLLAFGRGPYATDAQHVSVEFVHPVIVGKRALPAMDASLSFEEWVPAVLQPEDIVMGFGPPGGDAKVDAVLQGARERGAQTFALPGDGDAPTGHYAVEAPSENPFIHQEMIEILYHVLWETVHVFFEHRELGHDVGESEFLYPYLSDKKQDTAGAATEQVAESIMMKVGDDEALRAQAAAEQSARLAEATQALGERFAAGGKLILFGNGGSATDANDWAVDCVTPAAGRPSFPALSLSMEPSILSAVANDVGIDVVFLRQLAAQAKPADVAVGVSTSGSSKNVLMALKEARAQGLLTMALVGYGGGEIVKNDLVDIPLVVESDYVPRIQEIHASMYHTILEMLYEQHDGTD